jgi:hypothetical protein
MEEVLWAICNLLFELFGELILGMVVEFLADLTARSFSRVDSESPRSWITMVLRWSFIGALLGAISLMFFPDHFVKPRGWRGLNLLLAPLLGGGVMLALLGGWHYRRGRRVIELEKFSCGWGFAFAFALVRFFWCK